MRGAWAPRAARTRSAGRVACDSMPQLRFPGESPDSRRARALRTRVDDLRDARQRILAAADEERRRIERDLHDGAQQRLVAMTLTLRLAESRIASDPASAAAAGGAGAGGGPARDRGAARAGAGHPPGAAQRPRARRGAGGARHARSRAGADQRRARSDPLCQAVEAAAYFVTAEALTNVAKYAHATRGLRAPLTRGRLPPPAGPRRRRGRRGPVDGQRPPRSPRPRRRARRSPRARLTPRRRHHRHRRDPGRPARSGDRENGREVRRHVEPARPRVARPEHGS